MQTGQTLDNCAFTDPSDTVYMTEENLYLMRTVMTETASEPYAEQQYTVVDYARRVVTEIKRLSLQDGVLTLAADAPVPGGMFDSLSIDVENGQLRVATSLYEDGYSLFTDESYGWENTLWYDSSRSNQITVLDEDLNILGACKDILPGEQLACVRFLGDIACLQTEVKGDPLFAVELSDPAALRLSCALEQTGMAAWAQPYTGKLWFLFGQSVDENGFANGVELVMYDAVDADGIILRNRLRLDNCYSAAADEQHTLLVSPEQNLIGFPVTKYNTWANNFVLFSYGESGFVRLGEIRLSNFSSDTRAFLTGQSLYLVSPYLTTVVDRASWKVTAELVTAVG